MNTPPQPFRPIHTGSDADLAFAVVVLAAYFTTFSTLRSATALALLLMIALGVAYIAVGIYGYAVAVRSGKHWVHLTYFGIQMLLAGGILYLSKGVSFNAMVLLPLAGHSVMLLAPNWRIMVNIAIILVYVLAVNPFSSATNWQQIWSQLPLFIGGQIFIVAFTQMAVNEDRARARVELLANDLAAANQRLREYAVQVEDLAITKERNRLAREIHDGLGHYLTTIYMQIQAARAVMENNPQRASDAMGKAQTLTQEALVDVRRSVSALRDQPGGSAPLPEEITKMLQSCESSGLTTDLKLQGSPRTLAPAAYWTLYRAVQEGINNTCRHAHATRLSMVLDYTQADTVRLLIQDDGKGAADVATGGFGLLGMRERVALLNGEFLISTAPGQGFRLEIKIPG